VGTDVIVDQTDREMIVQSLLRSQGIIDHYIIDQNSYIKYLSNAGELEQDSRFFSIFHNLDYIEWLKVDGNVNILAMCGSPFLEHAASQIVHTLMNEAADLTLYFFVGSTRHAKRSLIRSVGDRQDILLVCTLLRAVIDYHPLPQQQSLLKTFLGELLAHRSAKKLSKLSTDPTEAFNWLLCHCTLQNLWDAFE